MLKKAKELSVLCDLDIGVIIYSCRGKLYHYCSNNRLVISSPSIFVVTVNSVCFIHINVFFSFLELFFSDLVLCVLLFKLLLVWSPKFQITQNRNFKRPKLVIKFAFSYRIPMCLSIVAALEILDIRELLDFFYSTCLALHRVEFPIKSFRTRKLVFGNILFKIIMVCFFFSFFLSKNSFARLL